MCWRCASRPCYFNPRTPVGCDTVAPFSTICATISIHAPQWGATVNSRTGIAPPLFQSTHPSGVRLHHTPGRQIHLPISIHAPQWGATSARHQKPTIENDFNPRTPVGCDPTPAVHQTLPLKFQSTHPSGVRRHAVSGVFQLFVISIHAPQWGATYLPDRNHINHGISIHAPQWGATSLTPPRSATCTNFNPRTPVGCDHQHHRNQLDIGISIHAPQWGATV